MYPDQPLTEWIGGLDSNRKKTLLTGAFLSKSQQPCAVRAKEGRGMSLSGPDSAPVLHLHQMSQGTRHHLSEMLLHQGRDRGPQHMLFLLQERSHFLSMHVMKSDIVIAVPGFSCSNVVFLYALDHCTANEERQAVQS